MRKIYYFLLCILMSIFTSCGVSKGHLREELAYEWQKIKAEATAKSLYLKCLGETQSEDLCQEDLDNRMDDIQEEYDNRKESTKQRDLSENCMRWVLKIWGYSEKDAKKIAADIRKEEQYNDGYSFDAEDCISTLLQKNNIRDNEGIQKVKDKLPEYGLSANMAEDFIKQYYDDGLYSGNGKIEEYYHYHMGNDVCIDESILKYLGFLEEEEEEEESRENMISDNNNNISVPVLDTIESKDNDQFSNNSYELEVNKISQISPSGYTLNNVNLTPEQENEIKEIIEFLKKYPNTKITVIGHTCSIGSDEINNLVGLRRAHQAKLYMLENGIEENRIEEVSKGATEPCSNNDTENGRLQNRRITFLVK